MRYQFATIEWLWTASAIRLNLPDGKEQQQPGSYKEVVDLMCRLGAEGWQAVTCTAAGNWLFWTMQKQVG
jgi:hypothetical protein